MDRDTVLNYIKDSYNKTKWPYLNANKLIRDLGPESRKVLNELAKEGIIYRREGMNCTLIAYKEGEELTEALKTNNKKSHHGKRSRNKNRTDSTGSETHQ